MNWVRWQKSVVACVPLALAVGIVMVAAGADAPNRTSKRAKAPEWSADVVDTFFPDAREKLVGERPAYDQAPSANFVVDDAMEDRPAREAPDGSNVSWSTLIDAETLEAEVKRMVAAVAIDVTTPSEFKGGGYKAARRHFSLLAALFGVAAEYDGEVRWQDAAGGLRDRFARAGRNAKVGTDQTYREASDRSEELEELVRGSRPQMQAAEAVSDWSLVAGRAPLMQRLNAAHQERLTKWLANEDEFKRNREEIRHEAQLMAMLSDIIAQKGYDYWDDETYVGYAHELRAAAGAISSATEAENYTQARQALDRATKACADCHDGYRG